ncbi:MAG TPA: hypothetical protein VNI02_07565 [Blastocatellia bacterium]|jgi:hypothetical protein|nr:hypothetical protein [Blastocatellia bacterium]
MRKSVSAVLLCAVFALSAIPARPQAAREATVEPETKARLVLQSNLNSKLNEPGDPISAVLDEPAYVNGELVLPRGAEFHGRVTEATPAGRGQKNGKIAVIFEQIRMPWGDVPVAVGITAIDDWTNNEKMKADDEGQVKGSRSGKRTAENVERGGTIGAAGGLATVLLGGGGAAAGGAIAGGLLGGLLLTKGGDVRVAPGAVFRIKFVKALTLPVIQQPNTSPRPIQQSTDSEDAPKKP